MNTREEDREQENPVNSMASEIWHFIFSFLNPKDLASASAISKEWYANIFNEHFLKCYIFALWGNLEFLLQDELQDGEVQKESYKSLYIRMSRYITEPSIDLIADDYVASPVIIEDVYLYLFKNRISSQVAMQFCEGRLSKYPGNRRAEKVLLDEVIVVLRHKQMLLAPKNAYKIGGMCRLFSHEKMPDYPNLDDFMSELDLQERAIKCLGVQAASKLCEDFSQKKLKISDRREVVRMLYFRLKFCEIARKDKDANPNKFQDYLDGVIGRLMGNEKKDSHIKLLIDSFYDDEVTQDEIQKRFELAQMTDEMLVKYFSVHSERINILGREVMRRVVVDENKKLVFNEIMDAYALFLQKENEKQKLAMAMENNRKQYVQAQTLKYKNYIATHSLQESTRLQMRLIKRANDQSSQSHRQDEVNFNCFVRAFDAPKARSTLLFFRDLTSLNGQELVSSAIKQPQHISVIAREAIKRAVRNPNKEWVVTAVMDTCEDSVKRAKIQASYAAQKLSKQQIEEEAAASKKTSHCLY